MTGKMIFVLVTLATVLFVYAVLFKVRSRVLRAVLAITIGTASVYCVVIATSLVVFSAR